MKSAVPVNSWIMRMSQLPPGPTNYLAPFRLTFRHYAALRLNPVAFMQQLADQYGDISYFQIFYHGAIFVNHPDLIRDILVKQADNFPKFDRIRNQLRHATGDGLLVTQGEQWLEQRVTLQRIFKSDRMQEFNQVTRQYTVNHLDRWKSQSSINIEEEMTDLLQSIMGKVFFGKEVGSIHQVSEAVRIYSDIFHSEARSLFVWPDWIPTRFKKAKKESIQLLRTSLEKVVNQRIQSGERRPDLLDMLLHGECPHMLLHADAQLKKKIAENALNQLLTMYVAGFHTTSVALAWLFYCVAERSDVLQKLVFEISRGQGASEPVNWIHEEGSYLDQVVKESLRLYPAAWELFARQNKRATELGGYHVPAGTLTLISPWVTQRDPRFFPRPDEFIPERFAPEANSPVSQHAYFPFGLGPHLCIGKALALMQMRTILFEVINQFEIALSHSGRCVHVVPRVSARPDGDVLLKIHKRRNNLLGSPHMIA